MQFQFGVSGPAAAQGGTVQDILLQILAVQRDQLEHAKAVAAANDHGARWRALVARWKEEFPGLASTCKEVLPVLERAYGELIARLVDELRGDGDDALDTDFALQEFLDRYGMRLGQLGHILNLVGPLADSAGQSEEAGKE